MDAAPPPAIVWNVGAASDYMVRGISQTGKHSQMFGGADLTSGDAYAGVFVTNVDFLEFGDRSTKAEIDTYAGYRRTLMAVQVDAGAIYYAYAGAPQGSGLSYGEGYLKVTRIVGTITVGGSAYYTPEFLAHGGTGWYLEGTGAWQVNPRWALAGALAHQSIARGDSYGTWNVGPTYAATPSVSFDLRYWNTDRHALGPAYKGHLVAQVRVTFP